MEPGLLLIPGPVPLPPRVLEEVAQAAVPHYGDAAVKAHRETREMLHDVWSAGDGHVLPIAGPGHAGLEALAYTFLRPGDRVVIVSNGFFGERTREVLQTHRVKADVVSSAWGAGPDIPALREALKTPTKAVAVVHNETSTGITNPLEPIVEAAHAADAAVIVDAVSSLGGISLPFAKLGIEAAFSASQKCIAAPAGIAPVAVSRSLWETTSWGSVSRPWAPRTSCRTRSRASPLPPGWTRTDWSGGSGTSTTSTSPAASGRCEARRSGSGRWGPRRIRKSWTGSSKRFARASELYRSGKYCFSHSSARSFSRIWFDILRGQWPSSGNS